MLDMRTSLLAGEHCQKWSLEGLHAFYWTNPQLTEINYLSQSRPNCMKTLFLSRQQTFLEKRTVCRSIHAITIFQAGEERWLLMN